MSDPTERTLFLMSLLQQRCHWLGEELAERLGVGVRTLRRDIERLRRLGYSIDSDPGVGGGYRLGAGNLMPPLMLDDDEVVAIAVGLRAIAIEAVSDIEDITLSTMAKLEQVFPQRVRRRVNAIFENVTFGKRVHSGERAKVAIRTFIVLTQACERRKRVSFQYKRRDGHEEQRYVEPHFIVALEGYWYLVAWDLHRDAWRTFRLDRLRQLAPTPGFFETRSLPGGNPTQFVARSQRSIPKRHEVALVVHGDRDSVDKQLSWIDFESEMLGPSRTRVVLRDDAITILINWIAILAVSFDIEVESTTAAPELFERLHQLAVRVSDASVRDR